MGSAAENGNRRSAGRGTRRLFEACNPDCEANVVPAIFGGAIVDVAVRKGHTAYHFYDVRAANDGGRSGLLVRLWRARGGG
jgi:hypothetical protein